MNKLFTEIQIIEFLHFKINNFAKMLLETENDDEYSSSQLSLAHSYFKTVNFE